ncbi:hypothetical protein TPHV1_510059 [Treponema phagedenis]|uniref:Uncharacterized protein n=1 Tax=Treponema phagedenis TaxID=162 RepID=A0A0B7GZE6_TREPH|nr:hypothetical protein TPHV1_510059 [Treponema phagedenis]
MVYTNKHAILKLMLRLCSAAKNNIFHDEMEASYEKKDCKYTGMPVYIVLCKPVKLWRR